MSTTMFTPGAWVRVASPVPADLAAQLRAGDIGQVFHVDADDADKRWHLVLFPLTREMHALRAPELLSLGEVHA